MATARNVWLPGAGVWACLPDASDHSPSRVNRFEGKRRKRDEEGLGLGASSSSSHDGLGFRAQAASSSSSDEVMCPICLGTIDEAGEAVLQWCMHRFCAHCIEEWSKVRRVCPLCKADFRGWFHGVHSNNQFQERILPEPNTAPPHHPRGDAASRFRVWRDSRRQERGRGSRRLQPQGRGVGFGGSAPFPTQRSFGLPRQHQSAQAMRILEEQAAAKALQWRKSIYNRNLRARPFETGKRSMVTKDARARAERRLEPWISRELQAVVQNSDHAFLARLVLGLWSGVEHEPRNGAGSFEAAAIKELKRFLGEKAELFWHELRCFAESPFTMQAYDTVVVYTRQDNARHHMNRASSLQESRRSIAPARLASRPPNNEDLENHHQILRSSSSSGHHRKADNSGDIVQTWDNQRKKRSHSDGIPLAEDRWQLSYC